MLNAALYLVSGIIGVLAIVWIVDVVKQSVDFLTDKSDVLR